MAAQVERECVGGLYPFLKRDHIGCVPYDLIALVGHELGAHRRVQRVQLVFLTTDVCPLRRDLQTPYRMATIYWILWGTASPGPPNSRCRGFMLLQEGELSVTGVAGWYN
uniref:Uncharacterized protein n=1 Tax=Hyaloperonospora arabidopsidis (strain Emoy2) TaxID=559515 RepID=M4BK27_HYAAE